MDRYIIESKPPNIIKTSGYFESIFESDIFIKAIDEIKLKTRLIRYHNTEKQKVNGINKVNSFVENSVGANKYSEIYQKGIKQVNDIMKFFTRGDRLFKSAIKLIFYVFYSNIQNTITSNIIPIN